MTTFSKRSTVCTTPNAIAVALEKLRNERVWVLDLTMSNPTRATILRKGSAILEAFHRKANLRYDPAPLGLLRARQAVASDYVKHGIELPAERVVLTASTSEAYSFLFKVLCDPGDQVLVPCPSYPLFEWLARGDSVELVPYRLVYDGVWHIDFASLEAAIGSKTKAVILVNPNNPTGSYVKASELQRVASYGLPVISDEVFGRYAFRPETEPGTTALALEDALVFVLGGLSKQAGLPQMKLAWIALGGPERLVGPALERLEMLGDTFLSVGTPVQHALRKLLELEQGDGLRAQTGYNVAWLEEQVAGTAVTLLRGEGGWSAVLRLPRIHSDEAWALLLLKEDRVLVHPGFFFDFGDDGYVVVSLLPSEVQFQEGIKRLLARVQLSIS